MGTPLIDLLCLPCAGASATMYLSWRRKLPSWINVVPVELPGRGMRMGETLLEDYSALVGQLCEEISRHSLQSRRWAIFGHSMGALLAYGIASRLRSQLRGMPALLFASGSPAPAQRDLKRIPDTHNDAALIADLRQQGGAPQEVFEHPEILQMTLDTLRADYRVCASFRYSASLALPLPIQVFAGRQDDIEASRIEAWRAEAGGQFSLNWFDGGHFFIREQEAPVLQILERRLRGLFDEERYRGAALA